MTSVSDLLDWTIYTILPTLFEIALICGILIVRYDWGFAAITLATLAVYITFTFSMTEWRLRYLSRRERGRYRSERAQRSTRCSTTRPSSTSATRSTSSRVSTSSLRHLEEATVKQPEDARACSTSARPASSRWG